MMAAHIAVVALINARVNKRGSKADMSGLNRWGAWRSFQPSRQFLQQPMLLILGLSVALHALLLQPLEAPRIRLIINANAASLPVSVSFAAAPKPLLTPRAEVLPPAVDIHEQEVTKPVPPVTKRIQGKSTAAKPLTETVMEPFTEKHKKERKKIEKNLDVQEKIMQQAVVQAQVMSEAPTLTDDRLLPVITEPSFSAQPKPPVYPKLALKRRWQGQALVKALVNEQGVTERVELVESSGYTLLDRSALTAVSGWSFAAAESDGLFQRAWVQVPVNFTIR